MRGSKKSSQELEQIVNSLVEIIQITRSETRDPLSKARGLSELLLSEHFGDLNQEQMEALDLILKCVTGVEKTIAFAHRNTKRYFSDEE